MENIYFYKVHLIISAILVVFTAFLYGFFPGIQFDLNFNTIDEQNLSKAIMGLYIGFSLLWVLGFFRVNYLKTALISNMIFMLGLAFGRIISVFLDGTPTFGYTLGTLAELFLGFYSLWVLKNKSVNLPKI